MITHDALESIRTLVAALYVVLPALMLVAASLVPTWCPVASDPDAMPLAPHVPLPNAPALRDCYARLAIEHFEEAEHFRCRARREANVPIARACSALAAQYLAKAYAYRAQAERWYRYC